MRNEAGNNLNNCAETVPSERNKFGAWANRVCGAWPSDLQIKAYEAATGHVSIAEFKAAYDAWIDR